MELRIEATDLPGRACVGGPGFPGYEDVHVAVQRRGRPAELLDPQPGDAASARWSLECEVKRLPDGRPDVTGRYVQGVPGGRFVYLSWVAAEGEGRSMFRRAKLMLEAVDRETVEAAAVSGLLVARLGLTDAKGHPLCAAVRPPLVVWRAGEAAEEGEGAEKGRAPRRKYAGPQESRESGDQL
ncbi:DUF5990 family protein [Streptomyces sp. NRRL WC-3742]|uniref:DUF5990 family protein n=1 Tax=Streptomyces sp. NRRL WC-3742 TaxID=1463934 RepID=UPI00068B87B7|nr:DUF5990 family protein [Streptomyces sp. NRRL WC-3742]